MKDREFEVEMRMFMKGAIRRVMVPEKALYKGDLGDNAKVAHDLSAIFYYGQNVIQTNKDRRCSVSIGDVIRYEGNRYIVMGIGFEKLKPGEASEPLEDSSDIVDAISALLKKGTIP